MCIIIRNLTGKSVKADIAKRCVEINSDGFGIVYLDGKGDSFRTLDMVVAERILSTETRPYVAHCRFATVGDVSPDAIHPFPIGKGRYLFQNGTLSCDDQEKCDTLQLAESIHGLSDAKIAFILTAMSGCRFAVANTKAMTSQLYGKWHKRDGVEYSKDNVLTAAKPRTYQWDDDGYSLYSKGWGEYRESSKGSSKASYNTGSGSRNAIAKNDPAKRYRVAVYGTLKYSRSNHALLKDSDFIGYGETTSKRRLCIDGLPYLIRGETGEGHNVEVEVYEIDSDTLAKIDALEGHPDFYSRKLISVTLDRSGESEKTQALAYTVGEEYNNGVFHKSF